MAQAILTVRQRSLSAQYTGQSLSEQERNTAIESYQLEHSLYWDCWQEH